MVPVIRNLNESFSRTCCIFKVPVGTGRGIGRGKSLAGSVKERMASEGRFGDAQGAWILIPEQCESQTTEVTA